MRFLGDLKARRDATLNDLARTAAVGSMSELPGLGGAIMALDSVISMMVPSTPDPVEDDDGFVDPAVADRVQS